MDPITTSVFELYKIGIGPSSSHTVGPMRAAREFVRGLTSAPARLRVRLFGSLAATGHAHGTHAAVVAGLCGLEPDTCDPRAVQDIFASVAAAGGITVAGGLVPFAPDADLVSERREKDLPHPNTLAFEAFAADGSVLREESWCSVGGGFIERPGGARGAHEPRRVPHRFTNAEELVAICAREKLPMWRVILANECSASGQSEGAVRSRLVVIWEAMRACIERGLSASGTLPGGLNVRRRAAETARRLGETAAGLTLHPANVYALAVCEENAAGGRVVTAPTNGAAGIVPAVLHHWQRSTGAPDHRVVEGLLTAAAIGMIIKTNASISGAEVGCQGEVGSACAMAAGALVELSGGTPQQAECAAEIGIEHNLGLTCDPLKGLVQVPCIERNAMGAVKALNAASLALAGDGSHIVSLDRAIRTMKRTGEDMSTKYKETARGGLAVAFVDC
jgi:L-serine dehydratase